MFGSLRVCLLQLLYLLSSGGGVQISSPPRPNLGRRLGRVGLGAHLSCGAPGPVPLRFWLGGGGAGQCFSSVSGGIPVGLQFIFFQFCSDAPEGLFLMCFASKSVRRGQISDKNKIGWRRGLGAWWGRF